MGARTGVELLQSLRDGREIWIDGARVADVTREPVFEGAARTVASLYDMQHDPALRDALTFASPSSGERVGLSFLEPRTVADLVRRREMVHAWTQATCGMFGRSPDFMNVLLTGLASGASELDTKSKPFGKNLRAYHQRVREGDLALTHTLVNPQVDRSKPVHVQDKDLAARIVKETDAGIVIRGARMVSTLAVYANELMVMPSAYVDVSPEAAPYAFGFAVPIATPGLKVICRPSVVHRDAASAMDWPLSNRLDETDAMIVFDDVRVPWERVFLHRDAGLCNGLYERTRALPHMMHQFCTKNLAKAEFMMGLGFALARSTGADKHLHVQGMLAEMIQTTELVRACLRASEADAEPTPFGTIAPREMPLWTVRMMFPKLFARAQEILQLIGAGGLVCVPSYADLASGAGGSVRDYFQSATLDARDRVKLSRLAFDAAVSSFAGRQQLYERYYSGDPVRLAASLYGQYRKEEHIDRIWTMLDDIERQAARAAEGT